MILFKKNAHSLDCTANIHHQICCSLFHVWPRPKNFEVTQIICNWNVMPKNSSIYHNTEERASLMHFFGVRIYLFWKLQFSNFLSSLLIKNIICIPYYTGSFVTMNILDYFIQSMKFFLIRKRNVMLVVSMHDKEGVLTIAKGTRLLDSKILVCSIQSD